MNKLRELLIKECNKISPSITCDNICNFNNEENYCFDVIKGVLKESLRDLVCE